MPRIEPFTGLLYDTELAGPLDALTAPPYDVISDAERDRLHKASPYNVVRLILSGDHDGNEGSVDKYTQADLLLRGWRSEGVLVPTDEPCVYPYEFEFRVAGRVRRVRGLIAAVELETWGRSIVPHERTLPGPMHDRLALLRRVATNLSPVFTVSPEPVPALEAFLDAAMTGPADKKLVDEAGASHRLWVARDLPREVRQALSDQALMIADGHHRYSVALAFREEMRAKRGPGPWDSMMMLIVDAGTEQPPVLPIHRLLHLEQNGGAPSPGRHTSQDRVRDLAELLAGLDDDRTTFGLIRTDDGELVHELGTLRGPPPTVCALQREVLDRFPHLRITYTPDAAEAERAVGAGEGTEAVLLPPTTVERVWRFVNAGRKLPEKSTYFWPKPRTGMVIRPLEP